MSREESHHDYQDDEGINLYDQNDDVQPPIHPPRPQPQPRYKQEENPAFDDYYGDNYYREPTMGELNAPNFETQPWYHAFCVGFDTNNTSESTWLCPRCTGDEQHKSSGTSMNNPGDQLCLDRTEEGYHGESGLSSKVLVSIADTGETAVVVSVLTENQSGEGSKEDSLSNLTVGAHVPGLNLATSEGNPSINYVLQNSEFLGLKHSMLLESSKCGLSNLVVTSKSKEDIFDKVDDGNIFAEAEGKLKTSIYHPSSVKSGGTNIETVNADKMIFVSTDDIVVRDRDEEIPTVSYLKRKVRDCSIENIVTTPGKEIKSELETIRGSSKRPRTDVPIEMIPSLETETCLISDDSPETEFKDQKLRRSMQQDEKTDIMSLNQDLDTGHLKKSVLSNIGRGDTSEGGKESGRRVKKIMRTTEGKDSSLLLQRLQQEIREAVQNKSTKDVGERFNPKLLEAFRAAVAVPKPIQNQKLLSSSAVKMKKSLLQKGNVRENLTKKIYATSNGRRKRAWDRDCEVEFWKHRCLQTSKPEKIETLKSVLGLLRNSSEDPETGKLIAPKDENPILSRLYIADTSIFPRKDNIKPVLALHGADTQHLSEEKRSSEPSKSITLLLNPLRVDLKAEGGLEKAYAPIVTDKGVNRLSSLKGPNTSQSSVSKSSSQREVVGQSDRKSDKRKWALEVLARKTAKPGQIKSSHEHLEDFTFKRNYPLLAQLPAQMTPTPTTIRRDKIPMHVRQTQLYHLTEHLLKQANLPVVRRTAATEFAVADAINIEKRIAERSISKLVYVNLCSQEVLRHSDCSAINCKTAVTLEPAFPSADSTKDQTNNEAVSDPTVEEALKNAGLLPESPPGSPRHQNDVLNGVDGNANMMKEYRQDNLLEIISPSDLELDISGGIENGFNLEDHKDVSATVVATYQIEGEPKVDVILSPLAPVVAEKNEQNLDDMLTESLENLPSCPSSIKGITEEQCEDSVIDLDLKESHGPSKVPVDNGRKETSTADGKESDGQDTEPQILPLAIGSSACDIATEDIGNRTKDGVGDPITDVEKRSANHLTTGVVCHSAETCPGEPSKPEETIEEEKKSDICNLVSKKVEAFIKEHIRPLCKSGVITVEQYRWAVGKTTQKVMKYHSKDKNANFLIKEGEKVKKLALQYLEGSQKTE
ncbi:unnamed protein product [Rhodiola kirilowii]